MKKKIIVFTGSRADYGLLSLLIKKIDQNKNLKLILVAGGNHFSKKYGNTINEIKKDKIKINYSYKFFAKSTSQNEILKYMGSSLSNYHNFLKKTKPDLAVVLGDRYEAYSFSLTAFLSNIKICHIHGGEVTTGAYDDALRHGITKFSNIHFACHKSYKDRIIQLGENPKSVFNVGSLGVEQIKKTKLLTKKNVFEKIGLKSDVINNFKKTVLVTFHPETLGNDKSKKQIDIFINTLKKIKDVYFIITHNNADTYGNYFLKKIKQLKKYENFKVYSSLGSKIYWSLLKNVDFAVGNSSSGIIEAPALKTPTINIGNRQNGRIFSKSIFQLKLTENNLHKKISKILKLKNFYFDNIFYNKNTSQKILNEMINYLKKNEKINKKFYDIKK